MKTWKTTLKSKKFYQNFQYCQPAQNQPKSHFCFRVTYIERLWLWECAQKKRIYIFTPSISFRNTVNFTPKSIFCWHRRYPIKRMLITKKIEIHILQSQHTTNSETKVKTLWEGHSLKKISHLFWLLLSNIKTSEIFFQIFCESWFSLPQNLSFFFNFKIFRKLNCFSTLILENKELGFATQNFCHL